MLKGDFCSCKKRTPKYQIFIIYSSSCPWTDHAWSPSLGQSGHVGSGTSALGKWMVVVKVQQSSVCSSLIEFCPFDK